MNRIVVALSVSALALTAPAAAASHSVKMGELAPPITLETMDGTKIDLAALRGNVVVINFWATWCAPCRAELPILDRYYELRRQAGLRVFAAATEDSVAAYKLKPLFAVMHVTPVKRLKAPYNESNAVPMNYVIDRAGRIRYAKPGSFNLDTLNEVLVPLLQERAPAS